MDLLIARNPDADSSLPYLLLLPLSPGLVFKVKEPWPRTGSVYCHPVPVDTWPANPEITDRIPLRVCERRGKAIDIVADRARNARSQIVHTQAKGRDVVFWNSQATRRQARPGVRIPTARAGSGEGLQILVDSREKYPYRFAGKPVTVVRRALVCGDYAVEVGGSVAASVERKSLADLVSSATSGRLTYAMADLASLPRAVVVVEDRYSQVFKVEHVQPSLVADTLAELQVRYPTVPLVFLETRPLAEDYVHRFLAAAWAWSTAQGFEGTAPARESASFPGSPPAAVPARPAAREVRAWAEQEGLDVPAHGRLPKTAWEAWERAHAPGPSNRDRPDTA